jgi:hypothetical protein
MRYIYFSAFWSLFLISACTESTSKSGSYGEDGWLNGSEESRWNTVADQFAGFSHTMMEVQYRYQELYWAGVDNNWDFAAYHVEHIEEALEAGIQRRPAREKSAMEFMEHELEIMEAAVESKDAVKFEEAFEIFRTGCNGCHVKEKVSFIYVDKPEVRNSTIRFPK